MASGGGVDPRRRGCWWWPAPRPSAMPRWDTWRRFTGGARWPRLRAAHGVVSAHTTYRQSRAALFSGDLNWQLTTVYGDLR
jgi:hypothetical protein